MNLTKVPQVRRIKRGGVGSDEFNQDATQSGELNEAV